MLPDQPAPPNPTHPEEDDDTDPDPDLVADEPPFSESSEEENPVFRRVNSKDSGFNPVSDDSRSQQSARTTPPASISTPKQSTSSQAYNSPSSPEEFSTPPQTLAKPRGRPKGSKNIKRVYFDAEAIGQRTRAKLHKGEYDEDGDYLMPILNDGIEFSSYKPNNGQEHDKIGQGTFINTCQVPSCDQSCSDNSRQHDTTRHRRETSSKEDTTNLYCHNNNSLFCNYPHNRHFVGD